MNRDQTSLGDLASVERVSPAEALRENVLDGRCNLGTIMVREELRRAIEHRDCENNQIPIQRRGIEYLPDSEPSRERR